MVGLRKPLDMFHNHCPTRSRSRRSAKRGPSAEKASPADGDDEGEGNNSQLLPEVASQFSSSCEIFSLFKVLAAGKKDRQSLAEEDVDSDESEEEDHEVTGDSRSGTTESNTSGSQEGSLRHVGSTRTVRPGDTLHDDDEDHEDPQAVAHDDDTSTLAEGKVMKKEETLRQWQSSFGSTEAELDAQGKKLAGKSSVSQCPVDNRDLLMCKRCNWAT